jgi:hypothetical protein
MSDFYASLKRAGLLNESAPDIADLSAFVRNHFHGTWCSSDECFSQRSYSKKGRLVFVGDHYLDACPNCGSKDVYHDTLSKRERERLRKQK